MVADSHITHCFYVIDSIPIDQKIILGMDFLTDHLASIDIPKREVTLDNLQCKQVYAVERRIVYDFPQEKFCG